jgi:SAM-dependent methyltransferase
MPHAALTRPSADDALEAGSIEALTPAHHDEHARQAFVAALRKHLMVDMARGMRNAYEQRVEPAHRARTGGTAPRDGREVRRLMLREPYFKAWSALRYSAQQLTWWTVQPQIERALPRLRAACREIAARRPAGGTLRLDAATKLPREVTSLDIHLMPGCFHTEFARDDVAQGALYTLGTAVFGGALKLRTRGGGVAASIARWLRITRPDFAPASILDLGCTTGANTLPYLEAFPGTDLHGVDIGAPLLRYAHARAEMLGCRVHYSQQNAESLDFADGSFDLVVSSFFLHEQSVRSTGRILREARRLLRPGGLMVHMELPPASETDAYHSFYLDWDAYYNNEPHYAAFRALDLRSALTGAGFDESRYFQTRIPNWGTLPEQEFRDCVLGRSPVPAHGNGASWFIFGAER